MFNFPNRNYSKERIAEITRKSKNPHIQISYKASKNAENRKASKNPQTRNYSMKNRICGKRENKSEYAN